MFKRNRTSKKIDLLSLSASEKTELIKKIRQSLRAKIREERVLRSLVEADTVTVNQKIVYEKNKPLEGITVPTDYQNMNQSLFKSRYLV